MVWIATSGTLGSTTTNVTFSNIPQTFTHLQIRCFFKSAYFVSYGGLYIYPRTGGGGAVGSYRWHSIGGDGSTASSSTGTAFYTGISGPINNSGATNIFAVGIIDMLDYTSTSKYKTVRTIGGFDNNGSGLLGLGSGFRYDTLGAIDAITLDDLGGGGWVANSRFDLYGITTSQVTGA